MRLCNQIALWLRDRGVGTVFVVSGGASLWLIHGIDETEGIDYLPMQHEQSCGFAADAYTRLKGLGACMVTSGPGATNLITSIASSWYDSIPTLYIAGQVSSARIKFSEGLRQFAFQQTPIVEMVKDITKFAVEVTNKEEAIPSFDEALRNMRDGRPGPALISICDDVQRS